MLRKVKRAWLGLALVLGAALTASAQSPLPYSESFDAGLGGWTVTGSSGTVVWASDATPAGPAPDGPTFGGSAASLNYNDGTDYDDATANFGSATSPTLDTTGAGGSIIVSFQCNYNSETSGTFDARSMDVLDGVSAVVIASFVFDDPFGGGSSSPPDTDCASAGTYHPHSLTVAIGAATSVQIRFNFDCVDTVGNTTEGWFVDNVSVTCGDGIPPSGVTLLSPLDGSTVSTPSVALDWTDATDTSSCGAGAIANYIVELDTSNPPLAPFVYTSAPATSSVTTTPLAAGFTYFWRVRAIDAAGNAGPDSAVFSFFLEAPLPPDPPDGLFVNERVNGAQSGDPGFVNPVVDETPVFSCVYRDPNSVDSAAGIRFQVSADPTFAVLDFDSGPMGLAPPLAKDGRCQDLSISVTLLRDTVYYWRAQYTDLGGLTGAFSLPQSFRIGDDFEFGVRNGSSHHGRRCYVATSAWGADSTLVNDLRLFRSGVLEANPVGRCFSRWYATAGSTVAALLSSSGPARGTSAVSLAPLAWLASGGHLTVLLAMLGAVMLGVLGLRRAAM